MLTLSGRGDVEAQNPSSASLGLNPPLGLLPPSFCPCSSLLSLFSGLSMAEMQEQAETLAEQTDATVAEQLTLEAEAGALRRALANLTSSWQQSLPTEAGPDQTNRTGHTNDTEGVSLERPLRGGKRNLVYVLRGFMHVGKKKF